ncbi:MAG: hypothetical protein GEU99_11095 [Luteitalea sp.]|nr:hypothetical protein [Luteitalea sp.]
MDEVYINVFRDGGLFERSRYGIEYPYIFPDDKEIFDKIPTISISDFSEIDGGPYPASSLGPIHLFTNNTTWIKGRHTLRGGVALEYSGEDDFDQINVQGVPGGTNNQNGRFEFRNGRPDGAGLAIGNTALGLFDNYAEIGQRALTKWRALGVDLFIQDSWRPTSDLTIEGGVRWAYWPPWYGLDNNASSFYESLYDPSRAVQIDPGNGQVVAGTGDRYNGVSLPAGGWPDGACQAVDIACSDEFDNLFRGVPRGMTETHANVFEPRLGFSYLVNEQTIVKASVGVFHNRVTLNDALLLGGNPPIQPMIAVQNGTADAPGGTEAGNFPFVMTAIDPVFNHPTSYQWSAGFQRELPFSFTLDMTYVGRRGLYLQRERNINQLPEGTLDLPENEGIHANALRPYQGFGVIRLAENAGKSSYHGLQTQLERRYRNGFKISVAYTLSRLKDNADDKRNIIFNTYDDSGYWGISGRDRTHVVAISYIYDLPFYRDQNTMLGNVLGGWQVSGATFFGSGGRGWPGRGDDVAGVGDSTGQPYDYLGGLYDGANGQLSEGAGEDDNFYFNPNAFARPADGRFGNAPRNLIEQPGFQQWDIALFKNFRLNGRRGLQFRAEFFNFPNHPNLSGAQTNPDDANFGRITGKGGERNVQLSLRFNF